MKTSESLSKIAPAMVKASGAIHNMASTKQGFSSKYLELKAITKEVKPILEEHGLFMLQTVTNPDHSTIGVTTRVSHSTGEFYEDTFFLPPTDMKGIKNAQAAGASISYARRYSLMAFFGIAIDDDIDDTPAPKNAPLPGAVEPKAKLTRYLNENRAMLETVPNAVSAINEALSSEDSRQILSMIDKVEDLPNVKIIV